MEPTLRQAFGAYLIGTLLFALPTQSDAEEPNAINLNDAIRSSDFARYFDHISAWLNQKAPINPSEAALTSLLDEPAFALALAERQLIAKTGADKLTTFTKAAPSNAVFFSWLLKNKQALNLYLEGAIPLGLAAREENRYTLPVESLEIWKNIFTADPDSKDGIYLKLAIATAIAPPGSINIGAGGAKTPATPLARYWHFKNAHKNKELFPSFDQLTVWEYSKIVSSGASDEDLTWARQMINTWQPDLKNHELVVNSTSEVWRRNSPIEFNGSFKNVLAGGGKCGPRSSWSVMICHAFGIPAIGVGQPGHACVAYKTAFPMNEPQPGSAWKVGYGRGWEFSKLQGMSGLDFLAGVQQRDHSAEFSRIEHLRWFASTLTTPESAASVMAVAHQIQQSLAEVKTDVPASLKPEEAEKEPISQANPTAASITGPVKVTTGTTHIEAAAFTNMSGIKVNNCFTGGKQVNFQKNLNDSWLDYTLQVSTAGIYSLTLKVAAANVDQVFNLKTGTSEPVSVKIPWTTGLWDTTPPVDLKLEAGTQTLRIAAPFQRAIALRYLELKSK